MVPKLDMATTGGNSMLSQELVWHHLFFMLPQVATKSSFSILAQVSPGSPICLLFETFCKYAAINLCHVTKLEIMFWFFSLLPLMVDLFVEFFKCATTHGNKLWLPPVVLYLQNAEILTVYIMIDRLIQKVLKFSTFLALHSVNTNPLEKFDIHQEYTINGFQLIKR